MIRTSGEPSPKTGAKWKRLPVGVKLLIGAGLLLILLVLMTAMKAVLNGFADLPPFSQCMSMEESKQWGAYVCSAEVIPQRVQYHGHDIVFKECWAERLSRPAFYLVWFPNREIVEGYEVCFTLKTGMEVFNSYPEPFFVIAGTNTSFGIGGHGKDFVFCNPSAGSFGSQTLRLSLVDGWHKPRPNDIQIRFNKD